MSKLLHNAAANDDNRAMTIPQRFSSKTAKIHIRFIITTETRNSSNQSLLDTPANLFVMPTLVQ